MKRTHFRNLWLLVIIALLGASWFIFNKAESTKVEIEQKKRTVNKLQKQKNSAQQLAENLRELDKLTLDEEKTTRLDILRHLDLQMQEYDFIVQSARGEQVSGNMLYIRQFELRAILPYHKALMLADTLHANKKVALYRFVLEPYSSSGQVRYGDWMRIKINGSLYGLDKKK